MTSTSGSRNNAPHLIVKLPAELLDIVLSHLAGHDIKNLRLTCKSVRNIARLRFNRVFLSPHPRDIQVFEAVAQHDTFRQQVVEIVYDDARFMDPYPLNEVEEDIIDLEEYDFEESPPEGVPRWYNDLYEKLVKEMDGWRDGDVQRSYHLSRAAKFKVRFDVKESYKFFQGVQRQQDIVIANDADAEVLVYGLSRFPQLRRITLTPATHGQDLRPLYETPAIRRLPYGFVYPPPRGWPIHEDNREPEAEPWDHETIKNRWRGFRIITKALAAHVRQSPTPPNTITEFVVDTNYLMTGLNCRVFAEPNKEYDDFVTFLQKSAVSRLDLSLLVGGQMWSGRHFFQGDALRRALAIATDLQHIRLSTTTDPMTFDLGRPGTADVDFWVPLRTMFPINVWTNLRHFGLVRLLVKQLDLVDLLAAMPLTLRSVELSFLYFVKGEGTYFGVLNDIRDRLGWRERQPSERPRMTISLPPSGPAFDTRLVNVDRETENFVYGDGENPFHPSMPIYVSSGIGTEVDTFEPAHTRPNKNAFALMRMGFVKIDDLCLKNKVDIDKLAAEF